MKNYTWKDNGGGDFHVGTYTGNGADDRAITGIGFQPDFILTKAGGNTWINGVARWSTETGDASVNLGTGSSEAVDQIQSFGTDGFTVGTANGVNQNSVPYYYIAFKNIEGFLKVGTYTGNGLDNRSITGSGFQPDAALVRASSAGGFTNWRTSSWVGDLTSRLERLADPPAADLVQALEANGFQIGADTGVNWNTKVYHYIVFKTFAGSILAPTLSASAADPVVTTTATLNGDITDNGGQNASERGFNLYNGETCSGGPIQNPKDTGGSYTSEAFTKDVSSLAPLTQYSYTAYAINSGGTGTSSCQNFTTLAAVPIMTVSAATNITTISADLNGNITDVQGQNASERGFNVYASADCSGTPAQSPQESGSYGAEAYSISTSVALSPSATYSYEAYATNANGTGNSSCQIFTTLANAPLAPTLSEGTPSYSAMGVLINTNGNSSDTTYAIYNFTTSQYVQANGTLGASAVWQAAEVWNPAGAAKNVTGLSANTSYTFKTQAKNADGLLAPASITDGASSTLSTTAVITHLTDCGTLSSANTTYILDNDVSSAGTCFTASANGITLDLNEHTVTYNTAAGDNVYGYLSAWNPNGARVTNGSFVQGAGNGYQSIAIYFRQGVNIEADHLSISYTGDNNEAIADSNGAGGQSVQIHDNVIRPNGTKRATGAVSATISNGGSGYSVEQHVTLVGGTGTSAGVFTVSGVSSGGVVTSVSPYDAGGYSVPPPATDCGVAEAGGLLLNVTYGATHYGGFSAISVSSTGNVDIYNNDIQGKGYSGIAFGYVGALTDTLHINNNTIKMAAPVRDGYAISIGSGSNDNIGFEIANNTIVQSSGRGILVAGNVNSNSPGPGLGTVHDNDIDVREPEDSGEYLGAPGTAVGIQLRFGAHDVRIYNNTITAHAGLNACPAQFPTQTGNDCIAQGIKVAAGQYAVNNQVYSNTVTVETTDASRTAAGLYLVATADGSTTFYDNTVTSNSILVDSNGSDGGGSNFNLESNTFIKGENPQGFHSIRAGYWTSLSTDNIYLDNDWQNGADKDDLLLAGSGGANYSLYTKWYLNVNVKDENSTNMVGATVTAVATGGFAETVSGTTDASGNVQLIATEYKRYGFTYPATSNYDQYTPHTVTVSKTGFTDASTSVTMDGSKSVELSLAPPDLSAPTITAFTIPATSTSLTVPINSFNASDDPDVVTGYMITESDTAPEADDEGWEAEAPTEYIFTTQGLKTLYAWAKDEAGNVSESLSAEVLVDTTAPTGGSFTINNDATTTNSTSATLNITCPTDDWAPVEMAFGNTASPDDNWATCTATQAHTLTGGDGTKTVYMRFRDAGGNTTEDTTDAISLDTTGPTLSFTENVEPGPVQSDTVTATWGGATVLKWDYDADGTCSLSADDYHKTDLDSLDQADQSHNGSWICLYGEDALGNKSTLASANPINIDATAPVITINNPNTSYAQSKTITASATESATLSYHINNSGVDTCSGGLSFTAYSSLTFSTEADNNKKVCYKAVDSTNNISYSLSNAIAGIDLTPPTGGTFSINNGAAYANSTSVTLNITCPTDDWTSVQMAYGGESDPANWTACSSGIPYDLEAGDETKTVYMRFRDGGGNTTSDITDTINLDSTAPDTTIDSGPDDPTNSDSATFTFSSDDETATFQCKLDGGSYSTCASPKDYTDLTEGEHTFYVKAKDTLNNEDPTPAEYSWTIDTANPLIAGVTDGHTYYTTQNPTFEEGTATLNGDPHTSGDDISQAGHYTLIVTDDAQNSTTVNFTIESSKTITDLDQIAEDCADGVISIEGGDPTATTKTTFNVNYIIDIGILNVLLPENVEMTRTGGGNLDLTQLISEETTAADLTELDVAKVIKFGIPNLNLTFSSLITITITVGEDYNGETLNIYYQNEGETGWHPETTCLVENGDCVFETTHATKFAAGRVQAAGEDLPDEGRDLDVHNVKAESNENFITITWKTDYKSKSAVRYGTDQDLKAKKKDDSKEKKHKVILKDLLPDTLYYFRIKAEDGDDNEDSSRIHSIRTQAAIVNVSENQAPNQTPPADKGNGNTAPNACSYTVKSGDSLWKIAQEIYNDPTAYPLIIEKNKDKYPNIGSNLIVGQELQFGCNSDAVKGASDTKDGDNNNSQTSSTNPTQNPQSPAVGEFKWWNPFSWF